MTEARHPTQAMRVIEARAVNPLVRLFRLRSESTPVLPGYTAGAHIRVQVRLQDGSLDWRHYSLINTDPRPGATDAPSEYVIAVRRDDVGRGGSRFMHEQLEAGDSMLVEMPKNDFPVHRAGGRAVLVAGGIGVTPLVSMVAQRRSEGAETRLHYAGRQRELMAFLPELASLLGNDIVVHADVEAGRPLDVESLLDACRASDQLYVCGPKVMLDAVLAATLARNWRHDRVHFELFTTPVVEAGDRPFEIELAQSGQRFQVRADQTILDCLIEHGCDPMFDCKRGECGVCATPVLDGAIDHRDYVLTERERAAGNVIQVCISRARGARLVLDI